MNELPNERQQGRKHLAIVVDRNSQVTVRIIEDIDNCFLYSSPLFRVSEIDINRLTKCGRHWVHHGSPTVPPSATARRTYRVEIAVPKSLGGELAIVQWRLVEEEKESLEVNLRHAEPLDSHLAIPTIWLGDTN